MIPLSYVFAFAVPFAISLFLMPVMMKLAVRFDFTDKPTERKIHSEPKPLIGGFVMFIAFTAGFVIFVARFDARLYAVLFGSALILAIGLADDYYKTKGRDFPVLPRFVTHIAAAVIVFAAGIRFTGFFNPFTDQYVTLGPGLQFVMTVLWIVGLVSVINFMDGLDGLAGSLCALSSATFFIVAMVKQQPDSAFLALVLAGSVIGFLRHNLPPARVIMGDSGAYLLGYLLAVISLLGAFKGATVISVLIPVLAMGVPIFDNVLVMFRRIRARKPVHEADTRDIPQIHYRLLKKGMKPTQAVAFLFLISAFLNVTSIILLLVF
ncbi:MAG: undecaprenyl/decaprenyl-phosphate alpha-N-acetylglucosaminyl 1-phosphate transferase [Clostridiales bacterium]|nr:undecaprenyl/decaprenyl-phosphate alpha-N-acetylglucosaminyl 1-phosphate transferase [Clostridiales bacterium]